MWQTRLANLKALHLLLNLQNQMMNKMIHRLIQVNFIVVQSFQTVLMSNWKVINLSYVRLMLSWKRVFRHVYVHQRTYSLIAFGERVTLWLQRVRSLPCAYAYVALFARRLAYNHYAIAHAYDAANMHAQGSAPARKSYSLVEGNQEYRQWGPLIVQHYGTATILGLGKPLKGNCTSTQNWSCLVHYL